VIKQVKDSLVKDSLVKDSLAIASTVTWLERKCASPNFSRQLQAADGRIYASYL